MYILGFLLLTTAFLCSVLVSGALVMDAGFRWRRKNLLPLTEKAVSLTAGLLLAASMILLAALVGHDFSLEYVARYSDRFLPLFYRLTAFWAGQEGSLLFWALGSAAFGLIFLYSEAYASLLPKTRTWFWIFFLGIQAFFLLLLICWSNPFIILDPPVPDGRGLNPLLQNPGMIFHPPLLFLGYAGFTVPACLALAQTQSDGRPEEKSWFVICRPFTLSAWVLLSAGIILGAWWAYMELGWGGYWAWDPVENASLIPWLAGTALLHSSVLEARSGHMARLNVCLIGLTLVSAFLATYIVRSGVVQSLHAFPDEGVGAPLFVFVCASLLCTVLATASVPANRTDNAPLPGRSLPLLVVCMFLLGLALIILLATLWPVISTIPAALSSGAASPASGLSAEAYNRACLPLFALLVLLLVFCPWIRINWRGNLKILLGLGTAVICGLLLFRHLTAPYIAWEGPRSLTSPLAAAAAAAFMLSLALLLWKERLYRRPASFAAHAVHLGLALMALGVAFSGPCKTEAVRTLQIGQSLELGGYRFTLENLYTGEAPDYHFYEAEIRVRQKNADLGLLAPQHRQYAKYPGQNFLESDTYFSLGTELYASLLGVDEERGTADLRLSLNPLINWIWVGGTLLSLAPIAGLLLSRRGKRTEE